MSQIKENKQLDRKARIFALFGDPTRLRVLKVIAAEQEIKVSDIAEGVGMSVACISHHLQLLKDNLVVETRREGNSIYYQLSKDPLIKSIKQLII